MLGMGVAVLETAKLLRPSPRVAGWMLGGAATASALVVHYFVEKPFLMARELLVPRADR